MKKRKRSGRNVAYAFCVWPLMIAYTAFKGSFEKVVERPFKTLFEQFSKVFELHVEPSFWISVFKTFGLFGATLLLAGATGVVLGLWFYYSEFAKTYLFPLVSIFKPIPAIAMIAIGTVVFGSGAAAIPWFVAYFGSVWPFAASIFEGLNSLSPYYEESALTLGKTRKEIVVDVVFPAMLPNVFAALRITAPITLLLIVTAEYFYPSVGGLGSLLYDYHTQLKYPLVVTVVLWMSLLSILAERILNDLEGICCKWKSAR